MILSGVVVQGNGNGLDSFHRIKVRCDDLWHFDDAMREELIGHSVSACGVPEAEDSSAKLVGVGIVLVKTDCRDSAVACDKRSYALFNEWAEVGKWILSDCKPVVVRMGIDEA